VHEIAALIRAGAEVGALARTIHAYPSWNEVLSGAASELM
jgi:pyruvate/2-oxoglutarate dehydrogenase complex dihydrolipoamide dehydrogenase (E3) component